MASPRVLIVDDEESIRTALADILADEGYVPALAADGRAALRQVALAPPDLVLLDIAMPGLDGLDVLGELCSHWPELPVVMMSGHGSIESAVRATKLGAQDFLEKPLSYDKLLSCVARALECARAAALEPAAGAALPEIIGASPLLLRLKEQIAVAAPTEGWILVTGENGTGKELVARQIHGRSKRARGPFIAVNCAAIPEELIESELFGHERGAFTGAVQSKRGRFELASGGTLFLDEIGDMSLMTQAKILRALQDRAFERVGGVETLEVDVRVVAATNKDLQQEMAEGRFREDLYYRLNVIPFHVPALRERPADIPLLVERFLERCCAHSGGARKTLGSDVLARLASYRWPGNVRELQNIVERMVLMTPGPRIELADLPESIRGAAPAPRHTPGASRHARLADARAEFERQFLLEKLRQHGGNISRTAEVVGLARESLSRKLRSLGIEPDRRVEPAGGAHS